MTMHRLSSMGLGLSVALLSACVTIPATVQEPAATPPPARPATATGAAPVQPSAAAAQKKPEAPVPKVEAPSKAPAFDPMLVADKRTESTGLLGKTIVPQTKYSKSWNGKLPYANNYAMFDGYSQLALPANTKVIELVPEKRVVGKSLFAYVRETGKSIYFIDTLEVNYAKNDLLLYEGCTVGVIGLFKYPYSKEPGAGRPLKGWTVAAGRFVPVANISKLQCDNNDPGH